MSLNQISSVAVIGAGPSGLAAAKALREYGLSPTVFERSDEIGGIWRTDGLGPTWQGMRTNLSKHSCCFSDLTHPRSTSEFPTVSEMAAYLASYNSSFGLASAVRLETPITALEPTREGRWRCTYALGPNARCEETFDAAVIASGFFSRGPIPDALSEPLSQFSGRILHSSEYREREQFRGQRVVVIGHGLSGVEIAADLCGMAGEVTHLFRRPSWIIPRYLADSSHSDRALPLDLVFYRRSKPTNDAPLTREESLRRRNRYFASLSGQNSLGIPALEIDPNSTGAFSVAISDSYLDRVAAGVLQVQRADLSDSSGGRLQLSDGTSLLADAIILATGYQFELPYLPSALKREIEFAEKDPLQPAILAHACLPAGRRNLGFVGTYKGPYFGTIELQARLVAACMADSSAALFERATGMKVLEEERLIRSATPRPQFPHPNYVQFADELAELAGCKPAFPAETSLPTNVENLPVIPAQYRLRGAHAKPEIARVAITELSELYFSKGSQATPPSSTELAEKQ